MNQAADASIHPDLAGAAELLQSARAGSISEELSNGGINPKFAAEEQDASETPPLLTDLSRQTSKSKDEDSTTIHQLGQFLRLPDIQIQNVQRTTTVR